MKKLISSCLMALFCLTLFAQQSAETNPVALKETVWLLQSVDGKTINVNASPKPYIVFDLGGQYYGNFGCNTFFGNYSAKKVKMKLKYSGATKKLCNSMEVETAFMSALKKNVNTYAIQGETLTLFADGQAVMVFKKGGKKDTVSLQADPTTDTQNGATETDNDKNEREIQRTDQEEVTE